MSFRVHGGRRIAAPIGRAYRLLLDAKAEGVGVARTAATSFLARDAGMRIDRARIDGSEADAPLHRAWCDLDDRLRDMRRTRVRDPEVDFGMELYLFPRHGDTLAIMATEQRVLRDWFDALPFVEDHSWHDGERDEDVGATVWRARGRAWRRMLPGAGIPADRCLTFAVSSSERVWPVDPADALAHVPDVTTRLGVVAKRLAIEKRLAELLAASGPPSPLAAAVRASREVDEDGRLVDAVAASIRHAIRPITVQDLHGPPAREDDADPDDAPA